MVKNWLVLGSVAFGVGFSLSLPITRNLKDSALIGLVTLPAATAGAFVVSRQQKRGMGLALSSLQTEIQSLEQQKDALKQSVTAFRDRQKAAEEKFSGLEAQREQAHAQLSTLEQQKQVIQQELVALEEQRQALQPIFSSLQTEVESLEQQKQTLEQSIDSIRSQRQPVEKELEQLKTQKAQIQIQLETEEQQRQATQRELTALEKQKQSLTEEAYHLEARLQELKVQDTQLSISLSALTAHQNQLDDQLGTREQERQVSQQELVVLEAHKQALSKEALALESRLEGLRAQEHELLRLLTQQSEQKQTIEIDLTRLRGQLQTDQQHKLSLTQELERLSSQRSELTECLQQLHEQIRAAQIQSSQQTIIRKDSLTELSEPPTVNSRSLPIGADTSETSSDALAVADLAQETLAMIIDQRSQPIELLEQEEFEAPDTATDFRLANPEHTRWLWEGVVVPRWQYPRFLGSVCLPRYDTDDVWGTETILDLVGDNLRRVGTNYLEYNRLYDRFGDEEHLNWLNILTFAMSEHAYYMEAEGGFWKGLCERLGLPYQDDSHEPISTLKELAAEGINFLKLPKAVGGYPIVSTLWLQSGIPYRNLNHFADLVADLARELGWNYLLTADAELLAQKLLDSCQNSRYQGRTVLRRFDSLLISDDVSWLSSDRDRAL